MHGQSPRSPARRARRERRLLAAGALAALLLAAQSALPAPGADQPRFLLAWGKKGDRPGEFHSPIGIAINKKDEVYVADLNNARVQKFTSRGEHLGGFDLPRDTPDRKSSIAGGIAVDEDGLIYLTFMVQHRVGVYNDAGQLVREWGKRGAAGGELSSPGGLVFGPGGTVYVADQCNHRIQQFTREGKFLAKWGAHGPGPGQFGGNDKGGSRFGGPHFLAMDREGRLYTTEGTPGRVQQFSPEGRPLRAWGSKGGEPGGFGGLKTGYAGPTFGPIGVMVDRSNRVWVSSLNDRVQAFTPEGKLLMAISGTGAGPGQLVRPHGMAVDSKGCLYIADAGNQRIQKFELPGP